MLRTSYSVHIKNDMHTHTYTNACNVFTHAHIYIYLLCIYVLHHVPRYNGDALGVYWSAVDCDNATQVPIHPSPLGCASHFFSRTITRGWEPFLCTENTLIYIYIYIYTCIQYVNIHTSYIHIKMDLSDDRVPRTWFILIMFPNFQSPFRGSKISQRIILLSCLVMSLETYTNNMNLNGKFLSIKNSPTTAYPIYLQQIIP